MPLALRLAVVVAVVALYLLLPSGLFPPVALALVQLEDRRAVDACRRLPRPVDEGRLRRRTAAP